METARKCIRCQSELPKDSGYCISCGCQNEDVFAKQHTAVFKRQQQVQNMKDRQETNNFLRGLFRFFK